MKTKDIIEYYGGVKWVALELGISEQAVRQWGKEPPKGRAYQIEILTKGELKVKSGRRSCA